MKVVFFGTPEFALTVLKAIAKDHQIMAVVTQPDKPRGRDLKPQPGPVKVWALKQGYTLVQPANLKEEKFINFMHDLNWEVGVVAAYGRIIPEWLLQLPKYGLINVHGSLLPKYRGAAPIQRAILNGETWTGITIMQMDAGLDTGPILMQKAVMINNKNAGLLSEELAQVGAYLVKKTLSKLAKGEIVKVEQNAKLATLAPPLKKEELQLDWAKPGEVIKRKVQALAPKPGAYTFYHNLRLKIYQVDVVSSEQTGQPGQILVTTDALLVFCQPGVIKIKTLQPAGKKVMSVSEFLRGYKLVSGSFFGQLAC